MNGGWLLKVTLILVSVPVVLLGALYLGQRELIYHLDTTDVGSVRGRVPGGQDVTLRTADGLQLSAWQLPPSGPDRRVAVLYCPGNGGNRLGRLEVGTALAAKGFTVLLLDYRGAGGNPGSPSETGMVADAHAAVDYLHGLGFDHGHLLYLGESIGTGVVAHLAADVRPAGILLRSPFPSLADVVSDHYPLLPRFLLKDRFRSADHLRAVRAPVRIVYGDADAVVDPELSARLAREVGTLQGVTVVPGADHNDAIWFGPRLADEAMILAEAVVG